MKDRFAAKLDELMNGGGLSGAELGRRLNGTDKSIVSRWRSGQQLPEPETVCRIADVFGIDRLAFLQLAGYLPGEPDPRAIDPRRASLIRIVRDEVSDADLEYVARFLHPLAVLPTNKLPPERRRRRVTKDESALGIHNGDLPFQTGRSYRSDFPKRWLIERLQSLATPA